MRIDSVSGHQNLINADNSRRRIRGIPVCITCNQHMYVATDLLGSGNGVQGCASYLTVFMFA
jgi:hypothetical protein